MKLSREIRLSLIGNADAFGQPRFNAWAGWPSTLAVAPYLILRLTVVGRLDPSTGYVCNIKELDDLGREAARKALAPGPVTRDARDVARRIWQQLNALTWPQVQLVSFEMAATPFLRFTIQAENASMVTLTQQFEFSAAHRLHSEHLSDDDNRRVFGKCNNPHGHGHNYVLDVSLQTPDDYPLAQLESTVKESVIDRLDHKHLNEDVEQFRTLNPTVENIAVVIWELLEGRFGEAMLTSLRLYETPKTWVDVNTEAIEQIRSARS